MKIEEFRVFKNKTILITGAAGFIGSNLTRKLVNLGCNVHVFIKKTSNKWRIRDILDQVTEHEIDLQSRGQLKKLVSEIKPQIIYHLAAHGSYPFQQNLEKMIKTNILGTANLINACREVGFKLFINTGTSSEYGFKNRSTRETDLLEPNSYYAVSKASTTLYCSYIGRAHKLPIITFRLYSVYGHYEEPTRFIPTLINYALKGKLPKFVSPKIARDFIYIDDVVGAYITAVNHNNLNPGEIFNLGSGKQTTIKEVVNIVRKTLNVTVKPKWNSMEKRIWDTNVWVANIEKIKKEFKWKPKYTILKGLQKTINWFKMNNDFYLE